MRAPIDLFDLLACPLCKVALDRGDDELGCPACGRRFPIVGGTPILLPDAGVPHTSYQDELLLRRSYDPWIHRVVMQSLPRDAIVLDLGAGNMALDLANVVRMDVTLTPYVDVVGDAHAMPFLPGTFDFVFSLAVVEHLRQPFVAAEQMHAVLRDGGYVYGECNFVYPYHGYPHHYFNASKQGMAEVFAAFRTLRAGVAPYQMPSFALRALLDTYIRSFAEVPTEELAMFILLLKHVLAHPVASFDRFLSEEAALRTAAGTYFYGVKAPHVTSEVIPPAVQEAWRGSPELQRRFPVLLDLGRPQNIMQWAITEGASESPAIAADLAGRNMFAKRPGSEGGTGRLLELPVILVEEYAEDAASDQDFTPLIEQIERKNRHIRELEQLLDSIERGRGMSTLRFLQSLQVSLTRREK